MLTFTELQDTPESVAHRVLGHNDASYAKKIWKANRHSFARLLLNDSGMFANNRAIFLPGFSDRESLDPYWIEDVLRQLDMIPSWGRANLIKMQKSGVDLNHLIGMGHTIQVSNQSRRDDASNQSIIGALAMKGSAESFKRIPERLSYPAEEFTKNVEHLNNNLLSLERLKNANASSNISIDSARDSLRASFKETQTALTTAGKFYANRLSKKSAKILLSPKHMELVAKKKGLYISDMDDIKTISKIARYGKWLGRGFFAFSIIMGVDEVYEAYKNHGDVWGTAGGVIGEIVGVSLAGALGLTLLLTPVGWAAVIGTAIAEGATLGVIGFISEKIGKISGDAIHEIYNWSRNEIGIWL